MSQEHEQGDSEIKYRPSSAQQKFKRVSSQGHQNVSAISNVSQQQQNSAFQLEQIIGMTAFSSHQVAINPVNGLIAYPAGCVIVLYSVPLNQQTKYFIGSSKAQIHSLMFSLDGNYLYAGEGTCKNPAINVWDVTAAGRIVVSPLRQLKGHKFCISQLVLSQSTYGYLVSVGSQHDRGLFVWDTQSGLKQTVNKLTKHVHCARFDQSGRILASCGVQHLKLWYFGEDGRVIKHHSEKDDIYIMEPKSLYLNEKFVNKTFMDLLLYYCATAQQLKLFTVTQDGLLCIFSESTRQLDRWMDLKTQFAFSLALHNNFVICSCSDSVIRVFSAETFSHITTLHKPPNLGNYNIEKGVTKLKSASPGDMYADCVGVCTDPQNQLLCAIYSDRTFFIWDIRSFSKVSVKRSFLNHSGPIYDLQVLPLQSSEEVTFFATASQDKTIRIWHFCDQIDTLHSTVDISNIIGIRRNVYCKNLSKILYISDEDFSHFKKNFANEDSSYTENMVNQVRCVKVSKDGNYLACGDCMGMLRIYSTQTFTKLHEIQAHDQEIMSLDFTPINDQGWDFLATGSRDRLIHVYDAAQNFQVIATQDEHTSSITQIRFAYLKEQQKLVLLSCSSDRSLIFREFGGRRRFTLYHQEIEKNHRILSLELSHNNHTLFVGLDKKINLYATLTGKFKTSWESKDEHKINNLENLHLTLDTTGTFLAVYNNDKVLRVRDCQHNNVIAKLKQGDAVTGMIYTLNNKHFITAGYDGCIFVWRLSQEVKSQIEKKKTQLGIIAKRLKEVLADQELKMSKEWTINSFWIEEELKGFLSNHSELNPSLFKGTGESLMVQDEAVALHFQKMLDDKENQARNHHDTFRTSETQEDEKQTMIDIIKFDSDEKQIQSILRPILLDPFILKQDFQAYSEIQSEVYQNDSEFNTQSRIEYNIQSSPVKPSLSSQYLQRQSSGKCEYSPTQLVDHMVVPKYDSPDRTNKFKDLDFIKVQMQKVQDVMSVNIKQFDDQRRQNQQTTPPRSLQRSEETPVFDVNEPLQGVDFSRDKYMMSVDTNIQLIRTSESPDIKNQDQQKSYYNTIKSDLNQDSLFRQQAPYTDEPAYEDTKINVQLLSQPRGRESVNLNFSLPNDTNQFTTNHQVPHEVQDLSQQNNQKNIKVKAQALQYSNLLQCHFRTIVAELSDMEKLLSEIDDQQDEDLKQQIQNNISANVKEFKTSLDTVNTKSQIFINMAQNNKSQINQNKSSYVNNLSILDQSKLQDEEIKNLVIHHSRDILDNYSKMLFEEISKQFKQNQQ